jgi:hypothetical protein
MSYLKIYLNAQGERKCMDIVNPVGKNGAPAAIGAVASVPSVSAVGATA